MDLPLKDLLKHHKLILAEAAIAERLRRQDGITLHPTLFNSPLIYDEKAGKLMTGLVPPPAGRFVTQPLVSESIVADNQWHQVGFAWDGSYRILYVDGAEVARDTAAQNPLKSADSGMYIGAGKNLDAAAFFSGLIDNVQIYNTALSAEEIAALAK